MKTLNELTEERYNLITDIVELKRKIKIKENKLEYVKKLIKIELDELDEEDEEPNLQTLRRVFHDI